MSTILPPKRTAIELAVVVAGLSLPAMLLPALGKAKAEANRIKCTNLKSTQPFVAIGLASTQLKNHRFADLILNIAELQTPKILVSPCGRKQNAFGRR